MKPRYMLDTNICIYLLKESRPEVIARFSRCVVGEAVMSSITFAELVFGASVAADSARAMQEVLKLVDAVPVVPFGQETAEAYAEIRKSVPDRKTDALDKLIAAHAGSLRTIIVTNNESDFSRYPGVKVENWVDRQATSR